MLEKREIEIDKYIDICKYIDREIQQRKKEENKMINDMKKDDKGRKKKENKII